MSRYSFWFTQNPIVSSKKKQQKKSFEDSKLCSPQNKTKFDRQNDLIYKRVVLLLNKYKDNKDIRQEILADISIYEINYSIALECKCKKTISEIIKEIHNKKNQYY